MSVHTGSITRRGHLRKRCLAPRRDGGRWADRPARPVVSVENLGVVRVVRPLEAWMPSHLAGHQSVEIRGIHD